jgi:hypothetical protein
MNRKQPVPGIADKGELERRAEKCRVESVLSGDREMGLAEAQRLADAASAGAGHVDEDRPMLAVPFHVRVEMIAEGTQQERLNLPWDIPLGAPDRRAQARAFAECYSGSIETLDRIGRLGPSFRASAPSHQRIISPSK